jgi:hypothetical protein
MLFISGLHSFMKKKLFLRKSLQIFFSCFICTVYNTGGVSHRQAGKGTSAQKLFFWSVNVDLFFIFVLVYNHARGVTQADRKRHISTKIVFSGESL